MEINVMTLVIDTKSIACFLITYALHTLAITTSSELATYATIAAAVSTVLINVINSIKKWKK